MSRNDRAIRRRSGEWVEVRSLAEIVGTLDAGGKLDGMLFMPEMARHCGRRFRIYRRADKTCVEGRRLRRLKDTVLLEGLRCKGECHGACQRGCLFFWKTAWLKPVSGRACELAGEPAPLPREASQLPTTKDGRYYCQSTELYGATVPLSRWNVWYHVRDLFLGEATLAKACRIVAVIVGNRVRRLLGQPIGVQGTKGRTPVATLDLQPGEWVEIRSREDIQETLSPEGRNRGLGFEQEMLEHCGRRYRVAYSVRNIIVEQTGEMVQMENTVVLEGVACQGHCARNCPRSSLFYWREIWLKRVEPPVDSPPCEEECLLALTR